MNKNTPVFDFVSEDDTVYALQIGSPMNEDYAPLSVEIDDSVVNRKSFNEWLENRRIPASRVQLEQGLEKLSGSARCSVSRTTLAEKSFYLSLSDQYWIKPHGVDLVWGDINFFTNSFSHDVGNALFDDVQTENPNLISPCNSSDGVLRKKWIISDNRRILVKAGTGSICQEVFNEQFASAVCGLLKYNNYTEYAVTLIGSQPASLCECFINENTELVTANDILKHFLPNYRSTPYDHFVKCCERLGFDVRPHIDEMVVVDYIIGNTDRHYRNFGLIRDVNLLEIISAAPHYDFGSSLCHQIADNRIDIFADIKSKPFADYHSEQITLVSSPERFELSALSRLPDIAKDIFSQYDIIPTDRVNTLCSFVANRVKTLDKALCKGGYYGAEIGKGR
jgi:hypothetical protein